MTPPVRLRLDLAYDGTDFSGWAVQPDRRTVAGEVVAALDRLFGADGHWGLTVAGRTDAGVHAVGQVCHVDVSPAAWQRWEHSLRHRLAGVLPPDVRITAVTPVAEEFHARFSALQRRYRYRVSDDPSGADPLRRRDTLAWRHRLDLPRMRHAATALVGEHDFAAYCRRRPDATTVRTLQHFDWHRDGDGVLVANVAADAFCHMMVRSLVGAMLAVGEGRKPAGWPASLLARRERAGEVRVAPAHGLTLVEVVYPDGPDAWRERAQQTRRRRQVPAG